MTTDNTQAPEYLQEQLVKQGNVSSMRYIGDDYTRIIEIREDRLLDVITAYTNKQIEEILDRFNIDWRNELSPSQKVAWDRFVNGGRVYFAEYHEMYYTPLFRVGADTPLKALLKLTIALSEAGELNG